MTLAELLQKCNYTQWAITTAHVPILDKDGRYVNIDLKVITKEGTYYVDHIEITYEAK